MAVELSPKVSKNEASSIRVFQEAQHRVEEIRRETKEVTETALRALDEAIGIANQTSEAVKSTSWALAKAAKEVIEAPQRAAKERWVNS